MATKHKKQAIEAAYKKNAPWRQIVREAQLRRKDFRQALKDPGTFLHPGTKDFKRTGAAPSSEAIKAELTKRQNTKRYLSWETKGKARKKATKTFYNAKGEPKKFR